MLRHLTIATALAVPLAACDQAVETDQNHVIILLDDVGPEKVGAYGHRQSPETPVMDGLAADGVLFDNAYAHPVCTPGRAALLTGRHVRRHGTGRVLKEHHWGAVPNSELFLPELLAEGAAYASALVGKYHLTGGNHPFRFQHPHKAAGFDHFAGNIGNVKEIQGSKEKGDYFHWEKVTDGRSQMVDHYAITETVDDAIAMMHQLEEPFFLVVSVQAAHEPWHIPPKDLLVSELPENPTKADMYDASVEAADTEIGRLLDAMSIEQRSRTNIVLTADNGTAQAGARLPMREDRVKSTMYEGGLRVPLIVQGPAVSEPGRTSDQLVSLVDVLPTLAEISGVDLARWEDKGHAFDGISLIPVLADPEGTTSREYVYSEWFVEGVKDYRSLRDDRWKLIRRSHHDDELYDLEGRYQEGPNLLRGAAAPEDQLDDEAWEAYVRLDAEIEARTAELVR